MMNNHILSFIPEEVLLLARTQGTKAQLTRPYLNVRAWYLSQYRPNSLQPFLLRLTF